MPKFLWLPYAILIAAAVVVFFAVNDNVAWVVATLGTVVVMSGQFLYAAIDSKKRWPGKSFSQRLIRILTFQQ